MFDYFFIVKSLLKYLFSHFKIFVYNGALRFFLCGV
jgi:hypothetical protein